MLQGTPSLTVAGPKQDVKPIAIEEEQKSETGAVMRGEMLPAASVTIDAHAVLRIVKHASDSAPRHYAQGKLTGMQFGDTIEVSCAVPTTVTPSAMSMLSDEEREAKDQRDEAAFLEHMTKAGQDTFVVGRYFACGHSAHLTPRNLSHFAEAVRVGAPCLMLVHDPLRSSMGKLYLKALVPTSAYYAYLKDEERSADAIVRHGVDAAGLLREVPVQINASAAATMVLASMAASSAVQPVSNSLVVADGGEFGRYQEKHMQTLTDNLDRLRNEINSRAYAGPSEKTADGSHPLKIETMLLVSQLKEQSEHLTAVSNGVALSLDYARNSVQ